MIKQASSSVFEWGRNYIRLFNPFRSGGDRTKGPCMHRIIQNVQHWVDFITCQNVGSKSTNLTLGCAKPCRYYIMYNINATVALRVAQLAVINLIRIDIVNKFFYGSDVQSMFN